MGKVLINHKIYEFEGQFITYEDVLKLIEADPGISVVWTNITREGWHMNGMLYEGSKPAPVSSNLHINAMYTGNA